MPCAQDSTGHPPAGARPGGTNTAPPLSAGRPGGRWSRTSRGARRRWDLADPALRGVPVGQIAARWGFSHPAVFTRAFRAAYGVTPSEYRRSGPGPDPA
ncbi:helix-turn-helix domain-containing protein [Spirillospora sp. NPDC052242]